MGVRGAAVALLVLCVALAGPLPRAQAQGSRDAERKLDQVRRELKGVATERRRLEGQRGDASRQLRSVDEQVGASALALRRTETDLARQQAELANLQRQRDVLAERLHAQRQELAGLLRAAYTLGGETPLKLALAQDRAADASRMLAYHGYLQRDRSRRIAGLAAELAGLEAVERRIAQTRAELDAARVRQRTQLATLERDRQARATKVAELEQRYRDRSERERSLGRDAKALERLLAQLRATARKAAAAKAAADKAARAAARQGATSPPGAGQRRTTAGPAPRQVAKAAPVQVGGLGWPLSGSLLAGFGARMPDGRASTGLLIAAPAGTAVKAIAEGTVVFADWMTGYGNILIIDHGNGSMSLYAHNESLLRAAGDRVVRGDAVASVGNSGGQGRPGLYFELRRNGQPVNPSTWLQKQ